MATATTNCLNCKGRLQVRYVTTVKPTEHAVPPACNLCDDGDAVEAVIQKAKDINPERNVRILEVSNW